MLMAYCTQLGDEAGVALDEALGKKSTMQPLTLVAYPTQLGDRAGVSCS